MAQLQLTRTHRILIGVVVAGAVVIAGIGFAGSYAAVRELAEKKGFGGFSLVFPIGIDAGICVLLALDLLLTWLRIPFPLLRQTAWLLTAATIAFNGAASWPDPLGVGMHAVIPMLFVVTVEAARHAVGRIADITADRHMEGVRITRWLLSPIPTFKLWRRMKLWELRSYEQAVGMEQDRLIYQARLQARYGRSWRRKAPVEALMPLKLARIGVPLAETASDGLVAAGMDPVLLQRRPADTAPEEIAPAVAPALPPAVPQPDEVLVAEQLPEPFEDSAGGEVRSVQTLGLSAADLRGVGREFIEQYDRFPTADQLAAYLAQQYGVTDPATGGPIADEYLEPVLTDLRELGFDPSDGPASDFTVSQAEAAAEPDDTSVSVADASAPVTERPHFFLGESSAGSGVEAEAPRLAPVTKPSVPVATASAKADLPMQGTVKQKSPGETSRPAPAGEAQAWTADVTETGEATARVPQQQNDEGDVDPIQQEIELVAQWLAEAEDAGKKLSGAETARRLGVSPKTGQRRVLEAAKHLEESRQRQGRAHLRSVSS
ncbi:DUF2637 domain-containing protein [Streptomyces erythrochromogenes]|uniref:DUF2637 domain-containing protein n=1 Tax=Streptomyces erythrochromogenes TaxID=285574 RepID=UPI0036CFB0B0